MADITEYEQFYQVHMMNVPDKHDSCDVVQPMGAGWYHAGSSITAVPQQGYGPCRLAILTTWQRVKPMTDAEFRASKGA